MKAYQVLPKPLRTALSVIRWRLCRLAHYRVLDTSRLYVYPEIQHLRRVFERYSVDCVFDVGANQGQYGTMLRREVGYRGRIISFEPDTLAVSALRMRVGRDKNWEIRNVAVADRSGTLRFNIMRDSQFNSLSTPRYDETSACNELNQVVSCIDVPAETLAEALQKARETGSMASPYLKMDTQGCDMAIVAASPDAVRAFVAVQTEVAFKRLYDASVSVGEAIAWYDRHGFDVSAILLNNEGHFPVLIESDVVFVRRDLVGDLQGRTGVP